ncbi:MAG TPA: amidase, partial [Burkholderiaceae bacterium]|nr:amidase [Burkholderiaceae bacterium]
VKDNVFVAGVPLNNGASILDGFVPETDATIVTRMLDAGAEIAGKSVCEYLCFSTSSSTASTGPIENPRAPGHTTGGSSNGSAALMAAHVVDMAIGADQAGSIRMPSSFCGLVGLKATYGLIPYTGCLGIEYSLDHVGPMTDTVEDCALLLEVIAGDDGIDGRQKGVRTQPYTEAVGQSIKGMRIGVVKEGFERPESEAGVDETVRALAKKLQDQGAIVEEISIPWHNIGSALWLPICIEGAYHNMYHSYGMGFYGVNALYSLSFMRAFSGFKSHLNELAPTIKGALLTGEIFARHQGRLYAKARNQVQRLRAEYDKWLEKYDVLMMPTTPMTATKLLPEDAGPKEVLNASWGPINNTCPFDITGHPSISVNAGKSEGKPVGAMFTGKHFDDATLFRIAAAAHQPWT